MASKGGLAAATLVVRVLALDFLIASVAIIATAKVYRPEPFDLSRETAPPYYTFQDTMTYQYVLSAGVIGCAYTMLEIVFSAINAARRNLVGGSAGGTVFLISTDVVCSVLIATGAAAGLGYTVGKMPLHSIGFPNSGNNLSFQNFYSWVDVSCASLLAGTLCMVAITIISAYSLTM